MAAWRMIVGLGGLVVVGAAVMLVDDERGPSPLLLFAVWALLMLGGEVLGLVVALKRPPRWQAPGGAKEADGEIDLTTLRGVRSEPNRVDTSLSRFVAMEEAEEGTPREAARSRAENLPLLGTVTLATIFVGRYGERWNDEEIVRTFASLRKAGQWIEREAARWGARTNVLLGDVYVACDDPEPYADVPLQVISEGDHLGLFERQAIERDMASVSRAVASLGFDGIADLAARLDRRIAGDCLVWLILPKAAGRSHAIDAMATLLPGTSLAVCYAAYADFPAPLNGPPIPSSTTLAHELMHLFGATDKYERSLADFAPGTVTHRDIMRLDLSSLPQIRVDPLTAVELGWSADGTLPKPQNDDARSPVARKPRASS